MTYTGTVRNGAIVLEPEVELPEGVKLRIELGGSAPEAETPKKPGRWLRLGKHRPFKPFSAIEMTGFGPTASQMVVEGRT